MITRSKRRAQAAELARHHSESSDKVKAAEQLVGWWKRRKLSVSTEPPLVAVMDRVSHQMISPHLPRVKHVDMYGDVAYMHPTIFEEYLLGTGTFKLDSHVFLEPEVDKGLSEGAYARLRERLAIVPVNTEDPFTLEAPVHPTYRHVIVSATGHVAVYMFSVAELVKYFRATGKFKNPLSNEEFNSAQIAVIGYLANDFALVTDVPALVQLRERLAQEESLLDFLQSEVDKCFDDMLTAARVQHGGVIGFGNVNDAIHDLMDYNDEFVQHMLNLEHQSGARCAIAHSAACSKLATQRESIQNAHAIQILLFKIVEATLDAWKSAEDMTPQTTPRHIKVAEIVFIHRALLDSIC